MSESAPKRPSVTLLVQAMNEIDGMRAVMPKVDPSWVDQILVADGHSTDGTQEYAREKGYELVIQEGQGGRRAYNTAFPRVKGEIVILFSPNGKSVPERIPALIAKMEEGYDMVIASRYLDGAKSEDDHLLSRLANGFLTGMINVLYGGRYTDALVIYRAFRTRLFRDLDLDKEESYVTEKLFGKAVSIEPLLSLRAAKRKLRVAEIPGDEPRRIGGVNKFPKFSGGITYFLMFIRELWHWR